MIITLIIFGLLCSTATQASPDEENVIINAETSSTSENDVPDGEQASSSSDEENEENPETSPTSDNDIPDDDQASSSSDEENEENPETSSTSENDIPDGEQPDCASVFESSKEELIDYKKELDEEVEFFVKSASIQTDIDIVKAEYNKVTLLFNDLLAKLDLDVGKLSQSTSDVPADSESCIQLEDAYEEIIENLKSAIETLYAKMSEALDNIENSVSSSDSDTD